MKRAIIGLKLKNLHLIIDGVDIPDVKYSCRALIKADTKIPEVMAASIIAKVYRDNSVSYTHLTLPTICSV